MKGLHLELILAKFHNTKRVIVEGDNQAIMDGFMNNKPSRDWSSFALLFTLILSLLVDCFESCNFQMDSEEVTFRSSFAF